MLNAGIMALPTKETTEDGFEKRIGVNHMGNAYLVGLLQGLMPKQSTPSRIVSQSSTAHFFGKIDVNDLHFSAGRPYSEWGAYAQSKLANLLYAKALSEKLIGSSVTAVSVHPGNQYNSLCRLNSSVC